MRDDDPWELIFMSISFSVNSTAHTTSLLTLGQMIFGCDIILHNTHVSRWEYILLRKQSKIINNNANENKARLPHACPFIGVSIGEVNSPNQKYDFMILNYLISDIT